MVPHWLWPDITGVRRAGKSRLLESLRDHLLGEVNSANVIHMDLSPLEFEELAEYHALNAYVTSRRVEGSRNFVLIDDVQMCEGFERTLNSLQASGDYNIYITGSNAFLLSSDLATLFTSRTVSVEVFPSPSRNIAPTSRASRWTTSRGGSRG